MPSSSSRRRSRSRTTQSRRSGWAQQAGEVVDMWEVAGMTANMFEAIGKTDRHVLEKYWSKEVGEKEFYVKHCRRKDKQGIMLWEKSGILKHQLCQLVPTPTLNIEKAKKYMIGLGKKYAAGEISRDELGADKD
eukprot:8178153-Pyramimonas_sp.AAC.1